MLNYAEEARLIGVIGKPHGIKGEITIRWHTDYPKSFNRGDVLFLDSKGNVKLKIENIRYKKTKGFDQSIIKFETVNDRNMAEALKGATLYRPSESSPELQDGQYWIDDLRGSKVYDKQGAFVGTVKEVEKFPSNDNLVVIRENDNLEIKGITNNIIYIPLIEDYIKEINIHSKIITLKRIPEYI